MDGTDGLIDATFDRLRQFPPLADHLSHRPDQNLFHYTTATGAIGILKSGTIWASHQETLNDVSETSFSADVLRTEFTNFVESRKPNEQAIEALLFYFDMAEIKDLPMSVFVASFTERGDLLSQWERYAGPHGYSIGFDAEKLRRILAANGHVIHSVIYDELRQRSILEHIFDIAFDRLDAGDFGDPSEENLKRWAYVHSLLARSFSLTFKHPSFEEEHEWRVQITIRHDDTSQLDIRPGNFGVVPYFSLPLTMEDEKALSCVNIAPTRYEVEAKKAMELTLLHYKYEVDSENVQVSTVPLRS